MGMCLRSLGSREGLWACCQLYPGWEMQSSVGLGAEFTLIPFVGERVWKCLYGYFMFSAVKARGPDAPGMGDFMVTLQSYDKNLLNIEGRWRAVKHVIYPFWGESLHSYSHRYHVPWELWVWKSQHGLRLSPCWSFMALPSVCPSPDARIWTVRGQRC